MKKLYTSIAIMATTLAIAQQPLQINERFKVGEIQKHKIFEKAGPIVGYIDNEGYTYSVFPANQRYVDFLNVNFPDTGSMYRIYEVYDSLYTTTDYTTFTYYGPSDIATLTLDTIFVGGVHHQNNSGTTDTVIVSVLGLQTGPLGENLPNDNVVIYADTLYLDSSLTAPPSSSGYPITTLVFPVNVTVPNDEFALSVQYFGAPIDTFTVVFGFPSNGVNCPATTNPVPTPLASFFYPSAFYRVNVGTSFSFLIPDSLEGYWYIDCDGNSQPDWPNENIYQHWSLWVSATIDTSGSGIVENIATLGSFELGQNIPNPAAGSTTIPYTINKAGNVRLRIIDLTGRIVYNQEIGNQTPGTYNHTINTQFFAPGLYSYSMSVNGEVLSKQMVITR